MQRCRHPRPRPCLHHAPDRSVALATSRQIPAWPSIYNQTLASMDGKMTTQLGRYVTQRGGGGSGIETLLLGHAAWSMSITVVSVYHCRR